MKINPMGNAGYISGNNRTGKVDAYKKSQLTPGSDEAVLSEEAVSFSKIFAQAKESVRSPEDQDRIADIKAQIQAGTYNVDSQDVAESILGDLFG